MQKQMETALQRTPLLVFGKVVKAAKRALQRSAETESLAKDEDNFEGIVSGINFKSGAEHQEIPMSGLDEEADTSL